MTAEPSAILLTPGEGAQVSGSTGAAFTIKVDGASTSGAYSLIEASVPPGTPPAAVHIHHEHEEWFYALEGELTLRLGNQTQRVPAGAFALVEAGLAHTYANESSAVARFLTGGSPAGLEGLFTAFAQLRRQAPDGQLDFAAIAAAGRRFDTEYRPSP